MTRDEFVDLLSRFAERPLPALAGRHVYLWHGSIEDLTAVIPASMVRALDLHALAAKLTQSPRSTDAARRLLQTAIRSHLADLMAVSHQQLLLVTGCDLLSRYQVSTSPFFQIASEKCMVILVISPAETYFQPSEPLPDYVALDASAPFDYLRAAVGLEATVNVTEDVP